MAISGTASFNLDLTEIVEEAFERAGAELRSGYDLKTARRSLNLLFADWADRNGVVFPGRIGLISGIQEDVRWLNIDNVTVNKSAAPEKTKP